MRRVVVVVCLTKVLTALMTCKTVQARLLRLLLTLLEIPPGLILSELQLSNTELLLEPLRLPLLAPHRVLLTKHV